MLLSISAPLATSGPPRRPRYWLRRVAILLLFILSFLSWRAYQAVGDLPIEAVGDAPRVQAKEPVHVLILGADLREGDTGRADTLILFRLHPDAQTVDIVNIPRDTLVTYSSGNQSKINAAFAMGGADLVTEVVADLLKIPRPYYTTINFRAFEEMIDLLGGVEITVDRHYQYEDPYQDLFIDIRPGFQKMDGETALKFVRIRYDGVTNSDIARIERQQQFLKALQKKLLSTSYWSRIPTMVRAARQNVTTNIPEDDQLKLAESLFRARINLQMITLPGQPNDETGDWLLDRQAWEEVTRTWATE